MLIIGIDPGINGAICFFENGEVKDVIDMPTMQDGKKNKRQNPKEVKTTEKYLSKESKKR